MTLLYELWQECLSAVMFYTRLPVSRLVHYKPERLQRSRRFFPWVGVLVGFLVTAFLLGALMLLPVMPAVIASLAISLLITGAFHEDGFADVCDGFGGGWTKERILEIMKDSRIGVFGAAGLFMMLLLKISLIASLVEVFVPCDSLLNSSISLFLIFIFSHSFSRFCASLMIELSIYVQDIDLSKSKPIATVRIPWSSHLFGLFPLVLLSFLFFSYLLHFPTHPSILPFDWVKAITLSISLSISSMLILKSFFERHIGGYTGDCLGAVQQVTEIMIYLAFILVFNPLLSVGK